MLDWKSWKIAIVLTWMVFTYRAPVPSREQSLIVSILTINIVRKDRNHIFIRIGVHVMDLVSLVEEICKHFGRWCIHNSGRDDVRHVAIILVLGNTESWVRVKLANGSKMNITTVSISIKILIQWETILTLGL